MARHTNLRANQRKLEKEYIKLWIQSISTELIE